MNPSIHVKKAALLLVVPLVCFGLLLEAQAVVPPPDGGYPNFNTAEGQNALFSLTTGAANTAVGWSSLSSNAAGSFNTATGAGALLFNTSDQNTACGAAALLFNTTGNQNTAVGTQALFSNTEGGANTASGAGALFSNTTGRYNAGSGNFALFSNTTGDGNTANGYNTLNHNTTGARNVALGDTAGNNATTGNFNVYIGAGMVGLAGESNACYIASIFGQTSAEGGAVFINSNNKLGTATSSKRFKDEIKPMDKASEALFSLKPVSFRYKKEIDLVGKSQFGLVAEDVEKINPDLVVRDKDGKPYSVRYDQVNAMLLNEFLKEHRKVEQQRRDFEAAVAQQQKQIEALTAGLQKVSAQIETSKPAPQVAENNQ